MISVFAENFKSYRDGDCPWSKEQLQSMSAESLHGIAADHKMTQMDDHYSDDVTIRGILSCYTETAKHQQERLKEASQRMIDDIRSGNALLGEIFRSGLI